MVGGFGEADCCPVSAADMDIDMTSSSCSMRVWCDGDSVCEEEVEGLGRVDELLCKEDVHVGFKQDRSAGCDEYVEVMMEVATVEEGEVIVPCSEGSAWSSDTAGDERD